MAENRLLDSSLARNLHSVNLCLTRGANMDRITIFMKSKENSRLLAEWLSDNYHVTVADVTRRLNGPFDLGILDVLALQELRESIRSRKQSEEPAFLPILLITSRQDVGLATQNLWQMVDEIVLTPIEKIELQARLETLLRARRLSLELKRRNEDLEALVQAVTHDLRAYLRVILGFNRALNEDEAGRLDERCLHYIERIKSEGEAAQALVDMLFDFLHLGRDSVGNRVVDLSLIIKDCIHTLNSYIRNQGARVLLEGELPAVQGDPILLRTTFYNLISNGITYVAPGTEPLVTISSDVTDLAYRINFSDNGIGIAPGNHERIFQPFVRLHGVEEYPGTGLGLSAVRKAVELMGGRVGVESDLGRGSTFWVELPRNE